MRCSKPKRPIIFSLFQLSANDKDSLFESRLITSSTYTFQVFLQLFEKDEKEAGVGPHLGKTLKPLFCPAICFEIKGMRRACNNIPKFFISDKVQ